MQAERTDPTRRRPVRWGAVILSLLLTPVAGYVAIGRPRRALFLLGAEVLYLALAAAAVLLSLPVVLYAVLMVAVVHALGAIGDVARLSRMGRPDTFWGRGVAAGVGALLMAEALALLLHAYVVEAFRSPASSMAPTLEIGDNFFVSKLARNIRRGDVIVFRYPADPKVEYVKRVIAVGGDSLTVDESEVHLNGQVIHTERLGVEQRTDPVVGQHTVERWRETIDGRSYTVYRRAGPPAFGDESIPPDHLYVMGDNRDNSSDSRSWGTVPLSLVKGRALFIWWSRDDSGIRWDRVNKRIE